MSGTLFLISYGPSPKRPLPRAFLLRLKGKVVERNVLFARATVRSEEFKQDLIVLDKLKTPAEWHLYENHDIISTLWYGLACIWQVLRNRR